MPGAEPFTPDADYCVYCHAPAAGMCAVCRALCCGNCVELVMGLTVRRAVCHDCLARGERPADAAAWRWILLAGAALLLGTLALAWALSRQSIQ